MKEVFVDRKEQDILLFNQWKKTKSNTDFQNLYRQMLPALNTASIKAARNSQVPQSVFKLEAAQQFYNALGRFKPEYGVQLNTYIHKNVEEKLKRVNTTYQNIARIPERTQGGVFDINKLLNAEYILKDKLGRLPSDAEIATELGFTPDNVGKLRNELRKDLSLNAELDDLTLSGDTAAVSDLEYIIYYDLPPDAQVVYDYARGLHGKRAILKANGTPDYNRIAQKVGMSISKVSKIRKTIGRELSRYNI